MSVDSGADPNALGKINMKPLQIVLKKSSDVTGKLARCSMDAIASLTVLDCAALSLKELRPVDTLKCW